MTYVDCRAHTDNFLVERKPKQKLVGRAHTELAPIIVHNCDNRQLDTRYPHVVVKL